MDLIVYEVYRGTASSHVIWIIQSVSFVGKIRSSFTFDFTIVYETKLLFYRQAYEAFCENVPFGLRVLSTIELKLITEV